MLETPRKALKTEKNREKPAKHGEKFVNNSILIQGG
jgi:hypothetical protein